MTRAEMITMLRVLLCDAQAVGYSDRRGAAGISGQGDDLLQRADDRRAVAGYVEEDVGGGLYGAAG